jgi:uncharacterized membrane protein
MSDPDLLASFKSFTRDLVIASREALAQDRLHFLSLFAITVVAFLVRLCFLSQPMKYDESVTYMYFASKPLSAALAEYSAPNNHLFHTLLVHWACQLLGNKPWMIRLPAFIAGVLVVPASYLAARVLYNKRAALLAAALVASSSYLVEYSANARGYSMICLFFMLLLALAAYIIRTWSPGVWLPFAVLSVMGFYTIPIMLYPFALIVVWIFLSILFQAPVSSCRARWLDLVSVLAIVVLLAFILYSPVFHESGLDSVFGNRFVKAQSWSYVFANLPAALSATWSKWNRDLPPIISWMLIAGFLTALVFHRRLSDFRVPIWLAALAGILPLLILQRVVPFERVWLFLLPLYLAMASAGITCWMTPPGLKEGKYASYAPVALAAILAAWLGFRVVDLKSVYYSNEGAFRDAEPIVAFLKPRLTRGDMILAACPSDAPLRYYLKAHNVSLQYLAGTEGPLRRAFVIVNDSENQTLLGVLHKAQNSNLDHHVVQQTIKYESATLYELHPAAHR